MVTLIRQPIPQYPQFYKKKRISESIFLPEVPLIQSHVLSAFIKLLDHLIPPTPQIPANKCDVAAETAAKACALPTVGIANTLANIAD